MSSPFVAAAPTSRPPSPASGSLPEQNVVIDPAIRRVGVVGLGRMGEAFARNLIADGYGVVAYDRSKTRRDLLAGVGAKAASGLGERI